MNIIIVILVILGVGLTSGQNTCQYTNQLWDDPDPNIYWSCDPITNEPVQHICPFNQGFITNSTFSGCVSYSDPAWPPNCIVTSEVVPKCTSCNVFTRFSGLNPNSFYFCPAIGAVPLWKQCGKGKGFTHVQGCQPGCYDWAEWRKITGCYVSCKGK